MKIEFKGVIPSFSEDDINCIKLQKIPEVGQKMELPKIFNILEDEIPIDRTLVNFARQAFFEGKVLKVTIEYDERTEECLETNKVKKYQVLFKFYSHDTGETEYAATQWHYKDEEDFNMHHDPYTNFPERGSVEFDSLILSSEKYE